MTTLKLVFALASSLTLSLPAHAQSTGPTEHTAGSSKPWALSEERDEREGRPTGQTEPTAGSWKPWVISSGRDYRVPPPPGPRATRNELEALEELVSHNDAAIQQQI